MAIMEHITNSIPYRLYVNDSAECSLVNHSGGVAVIIVRVKIFICEKIDFWPKM